MNLDYLIPNTPKACRRLLAANEVIDMNLDPGIAITATQGMIDSEIAQTQIPAGLLEFTPQVLDFCQYTVDRDYRTVLLSNDAKELLKIMLASVLVGSERILILDSSAQNIKLWAEVLRSAGLAFAPFDEKSNHLNDRIVIASEEAITDGFVNANRDRVVLQAPEKSNAYWDKKQQGDSIVVLDFPKIITGVHLGDPSRTKWWDNYRIINILENYYPDVNWSRMFSHQIANLHDMKFTNTDPALIGKLFGVYSEFLSQ